MKYSPYRRSEPIPKYRRNTFPKRFLFVDTETSAVSVSNSDDIQLLKLGVCIYTEIDKNVTVKRREIYNFKTAQEFIEIMTKYGQKRQRLVIVGHNVLFDIEVMNLPQNLFDLGMKHSYPVKNGKTFLWNVKSAKGSFLFIDTANYTATSLKKIGHDIGLDKREIYFKTCTDDELRDYCQNDVEICEKFILEYIRFLVLNDLGDFKTTIASQAFCTWRYRFMNIQPVIHLNDTVNLIEKKSYHGGRTECFSIGSYSGQKFYKLDINSQYPYAMKFGKMPYELLSYNQYPIYSVLMYHLENNYLLVDCTVNTEIPVYPVLISVSENSVNQTFKLADGTSNGLSNPKVIYPTGKYRTWLHSSEFRYAIDNNLIDSVHAYCLYRSADLFSEFVDTLYDLKVRYQTEGNAAFRYLVKIILNALYGKFGMLFHETEKICDTDENRVMIQPGYCEKHGYNFTEINWFGVLYRAFSTGLSAYSFPAIAGAITANARMLLWNYISIANIANVFYSDTDSLIVNQKGYDNLYQFVDADRLGYLKSEGESDTLTIYGAKDYQFGSEVRVKGIPANSIEFDHGKWGFLEFEGFHTWRNNGANRPPLTYHKEKHRNLSYDKGVVDRTGRVIPYVLSPRVLSYVIQPQSLLGLF